MNNVGEYTEWKVPLPQGYIVYDSICRTFLKITEMKNRLEVEGCGQQEGSRCGY